MLSVTKLVALLPAVVMVTDSYKLALEEEANSERDPAQLDWADAGKVVVYSVEQRRLVPPLLSAQAQRDKRVAEPSSPDLVGVLEVVVYSKTLSDEVGAPSWFRTPY